jgi:putative transposase
MLLYCCKQIGICPRKIFADQGYEGKDFKAEIKEYDVDLESVKRREKREFAVQPKRWIVERTFAWFGKCRRLSKDYELILTSSLSMLYLSMTRLVVRRIACIV